MRIVGKKKFHCIRFAGLKRLRNAALDYCLTYLAYSLEGQTEQKGHGIMLQQNTLATTHENGKC